MVSVLLLKCEVSSLLKDGAPGAGEEPTGQSGVGGAGRVGAGRVAAPGGAERPAFAGPGVSASDHTRDCVLWPRGPQWRFSCPAGLQV